MFWTEEFDDDVVSHLPPDSIDVDSVLNSGGTDPELLIGNGLKVCFMDPKTMPQATDIFEGGLKDDGDG